jgi:hypothetical protein
MNEFGGHALIFSVFRTEKEVFPAILSVRPDASMPGKYGAA